MSKTEISDTKLGSSATQQTSVSVVEPQPSSCQAPEHVDPRVRRTRKLLEDAFRELMAERPYAEISVADITDRATVNRATFYAHFEDKCHLASTLMRDDLQASILARLRPPAPFAKDSLTRVASATFEFMLRIKGGCPKEAGELPVEVANNLQASLEDLLRKWFEHEQIPSRRFAGTRPELVATVFSWAIYGAAVEWVTLSRRPSPEAAAGEVVALLLRPEA